MLIKYFAVYDEKAQSYMQIFPSQSYGTAQRSLTDAVHNPETPMSKYPEDFTLYHIGDFDDDTGELVNIPSVQICRASELISQPS